MIKLPILTTQLTHFSLKRLGECSRPCTHTGSMLMSWLRSKLLLSVMVTPLVAAAKWHSNSRIPSFSTCPSCKSQGREKREVCTRLNNNKQQQKLAWLPGNLHFVFTCCSYFEVVESSVNSGTRHERLQSGLPVGQVTAETGLPDGKIG